MQTFKVKYIHGHFIETDTKKRILPVQGAEYVITGNDDDFAIDDEKLKTSKPLSALEKKNWILSKYGKERSHKILNSGDKLMFRVGNSKRIYGDESREYVFQCTLLEDLYLFLVSGGNKMEAKDWRLADCFCQMEKCLAGGLSINENFVSESLNKLFTQTVMFYFSLQRSGSTNVFSTFCLFEPDKKISFSGFLNQQYFSLGNVRAQFVKNLSE